MRICIIGTSNTIKRDGYWRGLEEVRQIETLDRYGVGGACSIMLHFSIDRINFSDYDYCIIDTCIPDDIHIQSALVEDIDITLALMSAIAKIRELGCVPVVISCPRRKSILRRGPGFYAQVSACRRMDVLFIDGYHWLSKYSKSVAKDPFEDDAHLDADSARIFGNFIAKSIARHPPQAEPTILPPLPRFAITPLASFAGSHSLVERKNSIRSDSFLLLASGQQIRIDLPQGEHLCAFAMNSATSAGGLEIQGSKDVVVDLNTSGQLRAVELGVTFGTQIVPLRRPLAYQDAITLRSVETSEHSQKLYNTIPEQILGGEPRVELGELLTIAYQR